MSKNDSDWLSIYIYQPEPFEPFLRDCLKPLIQLLFNKKEIDQFFFIRYWENGPHIRLRLKGAINYTNQVVQSFIIQYFDSYFITKHSKELLVSNPSHQNNPFNRDSIYQFKRYSPEIDRYGGPEAMLICERQFELSSLLALDFFSSDENWNYEKRLSKAIQLHILFVKAAGLSLKGAQMFFKSFYFYWLSRAMPTKTTNTKNTILEAFEKAYESQEDMCMLIINEMWTSETERLKSIPYLYSWYLQNSILLMELQKTKSKGNPEDYQQVTIIENNNVGGIYEGLIHMTNNRLGILNRDESYLAFVIMKAFSNLSK